MKQLNFSTQEEFENAFKVNSPNVAHLIVAAIKEALQFQKKTAQLFEITIGDSDHSYEITLPKKEWKKALTNITEKYRKWDLADEAIDAYLLTKEIDLW